MLSAEDNERLCRVGADSAMGPVLRRYWFPILTSAEIKSDGDTHRVRALGEDLVAFRAEDGQIGLMDESCPHRCASLALARIEGSALRCLYHGWLMNRDGTILETPSEPEHSLMRHKLRHLAYPVHETGGMVWAYLGPLENGAPPAFPDFEFAELPLEHIMVNRTVIDCNWVQVLEGVVDSAHITSLHGGDIKTSARVATIGGDSEWSGDPANIGLERPSNDKAPKLETEDTPYGFRYAAIRKPVANADLYRYLRVSHWVSPFYGFFPGQRGFGHLVIVVPMNDYTTMMYFMRYSINGKPIPDELREGLIRRAGFVPGVDLDEEFRNYRTRANHWKQDRGRMWRGESYTGIDGITNQDVAVQESMGVIVDRSREHVGTSDIAVIRMRRQLLAAARALAEGRLNELPSHGPEAGLRSVRAFGLVAPIGRSWQSLLDPAERDALAAAGTAGR